MTRLAFIAVGLAVLGTLNVAYGDKKDPPKVSPAFKALPMKDAVAVLAKSKKRDELANAAISLCRDKKPEAIPTERAALAACSRKDSELIDLVVTRLRTNTILDMVEKNPTVAKHIFAAIAKSGAPNAERAYLKLTKGSESPVQRVPTVRRILIREIGWLRQPTPKVYDFLKEFSAYPGDVITALLHLGTAQADEMLERMLRDDDLDAASLVEFRNDAKIIHLCRELLTGKKKIANQEQRLHVLEALFKDRMPSGYGNPDEDLRGGRPAPSRMDASLDALKELRELALLYSKEADEAERARIQFEIVQIDNAYDHNLPPPSNVAAALAILKSPKGGFQLERAVEVICRSGDPEAIELVVTRVRENGFRSWVMKNPPEIYAYDLERRIARNLALLPAPRGEEALLELLKDPRIDEDWSGAVSFALRWVKQPSKELLAKLDAEPAAKAFQTLAHLGTPEALRILERKMLPENKIARDLDPRFLYDLRLKLGIVKLCQRMLEAPAPDQRARERIVETLFDPSPKPWDINTGDFPPPPPYRDGDTESLKELLKAADLALKIELKADVKRMVISARAGIERVLAQRETKKK